MAGFVTIDDDGAASNRRFETDAGAHATFSVTFTESSSQAGRPGTDGPDATATDSTSTHTLRSLCRPIQHHPTERRSTIDWRMARGWRGRSSYVWPLPHVGRRRSRTEQMPTAGKPRHQDDTT